jgi:TetR/AcrR family transcriptional regulator, transcriptional repressor for nem operon
MSDRAELIMDAAERRIRQGGYNGFSFREIAADVGVKSSSVHHHFPTKEALAVAVARRYGERFEQSVAAEMEKGHSPLAAWHRVFRRALVHDGQMCLCGALGAGVADLPADVAAEAKRFFERGLKSLTQPQKGSSLSAGRAKHALATLEGAMLLARAMNDTKTFDEATKPLLANA